MNPTSINSIEPLTGSNFKKWKRDLEIALGLLDHDIALREEKPVLTDESTAEQRLKLERWEKANRICLLIMKKSMTEAIYGGIPDSENAKEYLKAVAEKFKESDKAETGNLMNRLATMKYDGMEDMRVYLLGMVETASKLKALNVPIADPFLVHLALLSLPSSYGQLKVIYNAQKDKWDLNELITICVQEEARIKKEKEVNTVHLTTNAAKRHFSKPSSHASANKENSKANPPPKRSDTLKTNKTTVFKCYFYDRAGHMKRECHKYKRWVEKKGNKGKSETVQVCFESNNVIVPTNSWWIDTGSSIHVTNSLQDFANQRKPSRDQDHLFVGNGKRVPVQAIGSIRLQLVSGFPLILKDVAF
ncbi:unnamed protein product, partial [Prunus brigantina]